MLIEKTLGGTRMNLAILNHTPNLDNVKELVKKTSNCNIEENDNVKKKIRIHDDPGELIRYKNKQARKRTNELYTDEYFKKFH